MISSAYPLALNPERERSFNIERYGPAVIHIPSAPLRSGSLQISKAAPSSYLTWDKNDHIGSFELLQKTIDIWNRIDFASQHLILGVLKNDEPHFHWEIVPFPNAGCCLSRLARQAAVLFNQTFETGALSDAKKEESQSFYTSKFERYVKNPPLPLSPIRANDAFCKAEVIEKQLVFEGRTIRVLYNYAPIGLGGEKLHFLIIPKEHRAGFSDLTQEEYLESADISQKAIRRLQETRNIKAVYLLHKSGIDAGQTVPHWHMHLIATTNAVQNFCGKLTVLKKMIFGASPIKGEKLQQVVDKYKEEFQGLGAGREEEKQADNLPFLIGRKSILEAERKESI